MSGIAGLLALDDRPLDATALDPALTAMAFRGPDGRAVRRAGPLLLGHLAHHTTPEAPDQNWPAEAPDGRLLVADARLDNREDLIRALAPTPAGRPPTDGALILAAHARWGAEAPRHLVGDFAYALWEPAPRRLWLVRSPFGLRTLYYRIEDGRLAFATTLRALLALGGSQRVDQDWVASFLSLDLRWLHDHAAIEGVRKLPPAHLLRLESSSGSPRIARYWDLEPSDRSLGWNESRWIESFRDHFEQAVAASLRGRGPLAMSVSGGLDSSSIALVAHRLMHDEGRVPPLPVQSISICMPGWPATDEQAYRAAAIARMPHFDTRTIPSPVVWRWTDVERWHRRMSTPSLFPNAWMFVPVYRQSTAAGCTVKVSGAGGDMVTGGEDYTMIEAFRSLDPWTRAREAGHFAAALGGYAPLLRRWLRAALPPAVEAWRVRRRPRPMLAGPAVLERVADHPEPLPPMAGLTPIQQAVRRFLLAPRTTQPFEQRAEIQALHGLELRCPFYDRRYVELAFQFPMWARASGGSARALLKRALADDLPARLRERSSKADFTRYSAFSMSPADHARAAVLPDGSLLREPGWIDPGRWARWAASDDPTARAAVHRAALLAQWLEDLTASSSHQTER